MSAGAFPDERVFICRMNLSRTAKRHIQYYKFVLVEGRYLHPSEYYQAVNAIATPSTSIQPIFAAYCQPLINPENADSIATGNTSMFRSVHLMDMKFLHLDDIGCYHLEYKSSELEGQSWYQLLHPSNLSQFSYKHRLLCQQKEGSMICLLRLQTRSGDWIYVHAVFIIKGNFASQPQEGKRMRHLIHVTYQILNELEAMTLQANEWIYNIKHHHFPRDLSAKENEYNGSNYGPESPESDLNETPMPVIPNSQICVEIPSRREKCKAQSRSMHSLMTPEHSSPDSSSSLSTAPKSLCLETLPHFYGPESDVPLPELGDDLDEFFRQVEYSSPFDESAHEIDAKDLLSNIPNEDFFKNSQKQQRHVKCEVPWWETETNFDVINRRYVTTRQRLE
uniref:PAS domain-containing protein n=1 Tax=Acrobeloides nanus TaxID=290746 RepID=A0A914CTG9_9BILA